jgi:hypothetical protein
MSQSQIILDSDAKYKQCLKEWKKCFSRTRKLDYYFNARTNESLWTLDEVKERINKSLHELSTVSNKPNNQPILCKEDKKESKKISYVKEAPESNKTEAEIKIYKL